MDDKQFALYEALAASHSLADEWEGAACAFYECYLRLGRVLALFGQSRPSHDLYVSLLSRQLRALLGALNALALHQHSSGAQGTWAPASAGGAGQPQPFLLFRRADLADVHATGDVNASGGSHRMDTDAVGEEVQEPAVRAGAAGVGLASTSNENAFELVTRDRMENEKALVAAKLYLEEFCSKDLREALGLVL